MSAKRHRRRAPGSAVARRFLRGAGIPERLELLRHWLSPSWRARINSVLPLNGAIIEVCELTAMVPGFRGDRSEYLRFQRCLRRWFSSIKEVEFRESMNFIGPSCSFWREFDPKGYPWHLSATYESWDYTGVLEAKAYPSAKPALFTARITEVPKPRPRPSRAGFLRRIERDRRERRLSQDALTGSTSTMRRALRRLLSLPSRLEPLVDHMILVPRLRAVYWKEIVVANKRTSALKHASRMAELARQGVLDARWARGSTAVLALRKNGGR